MVSIRGFISSSFTKSFLTIFLPFFFIISLIFIVKIASLTSRIQMTFGELMLLYSYSLPTIIFYSLPLSFIAALASTLVHLSQANELIALYALGLRSKKVLKSLLLLGALFSLLLTTLSLVAVPLSKQFYESFRQEKFAEAKINITPGELGQKFGKYYIYVKDKKENTFHNIVILNRLDKMHEQFFSSKTGELKHNENVTSLLLNKGYGYTYTSTNLQQAEYDSLEIFDTTQKKAFVFEDIVTYWSKITKDPALLKRLLFFIFISLMPLLSIYLVSSFTMINPRYQPNRSFVVIFLTTLFFYATASSLEKWGTPLILVGVVLLISIVSKWLFNKQVAKYF
ncbi:MAG: hypothetical protein RL113_782 [Pseudomonadota bacterium]